MKFQELGYNNLDEYKGVFYGSLMPSNNTKEYFVDWTKVRAQVNQLLTEIYALNSLIKVPKEEKRAKLEAILKEYPKTRAVFPLILVVSNKVSLLTFQGDGFQFQEIDFEKSEPSQIVKFCSDVGIMDLFEEVKDLHDYLVGVGVGRDTNARKNRSGHIFEGIVKALLDRQNILYVENDPTFEFEDPETKRKKRPDFVIYKEKKPVYLIEVNFYNSTGSKPTEIVESYVKLNNDLKKQGIHFIWITDGPAWRLMQSGLNVGFGDIDYIFNYELMKKHLPRLVQEG